MYFIYLNFAIVSNLGFHASDLILINNFMFIPKTFNSINGINGLSERQMQEHYKLYEGYVKKVNEISEKLATVDKASANATYSDLRALKLGYAFALNAIKSHELFFGHISGKGGKPEGPMGKLIEEAYGSFDTWQEDMEKTGIAARGWVWCAYDLDQKKIFNFLGDTHDTYPAWNCVPLVALDVYEHAYFIDYGVNRADYIKAVFASLDWTFIEERLAAHGIK